MQNRGTMLLITGALAFGSLGYFLFLYDDVPEVQWPATGRPGGRRNRMKMNFTATAPTPSAAPPEQAAPAEPAPEQPE